MNVQGQNFEFINLMFFRQILENKAVWVIGTYLQYAWAEKFQKKIILKIEKLFGHGRLCYRAN